MPRYMVELTYRYFMCNGYLIRISLPIPYKKKVAGSEREFYQFIDVLAVKEDEVVIAECRDFKNVKKIVDSIDRLLRLFSTAEKYVKNIFPRITRPRKILVVEDRDVERLRPYLQKLNKYGIEILPISSVISDLIKCSFREEEYRKTRGEGDLILAVLRSFARYLMGIGKV